MSCGGSSGGAGEGDPGSRWGSLSSTYLSSTCLGEASKIFGGWIEKSTGESGGTTVGSGATTVGICTSSGKRSKTEEEDREAWK